ncbi:MAG: 2-oxoglutarate and iron-dependent oxygenase domain-containing protein [Acidimicrobiales bacterium]
MSEVPVIDLASSDDAAVARRIDHACREHGFFVVTGHGVPAAHVDALDVAARRFFELPDSEKEPIAMRHGGLAWRGWFPLGGELTSGRPDGKEGLYFGAELADGGGRPMHGPNLFPAEPAELRPLVLAHLDLLTALGHRLVALLDLGFGAEGRLSALVRDPLVLFRIFGYPPTGEGWGVGEHTDYGLLTILHQDDTGGLEVHGRDGWLDVAPVPGSFVCNIGDMLEKATGGVYRSTPHRVRNLTDRYRVSMPFFFDPGWDARVERLADGTGESVPRWDGEDPHLFDGSYGDYVWSRVGKVFPDLA